MASWKSSRMNIRPSPSGFERSFQDPVIPLTSSSRQAIPVV